MSDTNDFLNEVDRNPDPSTPGSAPNLLNEVDRNPDPSTPGAAPDYGSQTSFSPEDIFNIAMAAGFSPSEAVTMTAIALAESGGKAGAENIQVDERSQGLWQINLMAHQDKVPEGADPYDVGVNAYLARLVYLGVGNGSISPWTVTHQDKGTPYLRYQDEAQQAARKQGYAVDGYWAGAPGYGSVVSADPTGQSSDGEAILNQYGSPNLSGIEGFNPELSEYSHLLTFLNHPDVGPLLYQAAADGLDAPQLQALLMGTDWWKTTQDSARKWEQLLATDPATAETRMDDTRQSIERTISTLGLTLDETAIADMAQLSQRMGWTEFELMEAITTKGEFDSGAPGGQIGTDAGTIQQLAKRYLVTVTQEQASRLALQVQNGMATMESIQGNFALRAEAKFSGNPALGSFIGNGGDPADFFADHVNKIGQMIGVAPESIDLLNDPTYSKILSYAGDDGTVRPMTIDESVLLARKDDRFRGSIQGQSEAAKFSTSFARAMGKAKF